MNRKEFNKLHDGEILYCNGMCHNFKGLKVLALRTENYLKDGEMVTVTPIDDKFRNMYGRVYDLSYRCLSTKMV